MNQRVQRDRSEPLRVRPSFDERWYGDDKGLIICWEVGRKLRQSEPELARRAEDGELPALGWKGGVEEKLKGHKYGTLNYLAEWQGLRGEDLDIDLSRVIEMTCSRTGMSVIYTCDATKWR